MTSDDTALRVALSAWLTVALDSSTERVEERDLLRLRDWIDGGCPGPPPMPGGD